jgi:hypothetical protein
VGTRGTCLTRTRSAAERRRWQKSGRDEHVRLPGPVITAHCGCTAARSIFGGTPVVLDGPQSVLNTIVTHDNQRATTSNETAGPLHGQVQCARSWLRSRQNPAYRSAHRHRRSSGGASWTRRKSSRERSIPVLGPPSPDPRGQSPAACCSRSASALTAAWITGVAAPSGQLSSRSRSSDSASPERPCCPRYLA